MTVLRWKFQDPADSSGAGTYTFPWNPKTMTSPFPDKAITMKGTTAVDGQTLMWEGMSQPASWSFGGAIKDAAHYEAMRAWVYDRQGRLFVWDHFGRRLIVVLKKFNPSPAEKMRIGRYWYHTYTIDAVVIAISSPTVTDSGPT